MEIRNAEYAAINTSDVIYDVKFTIFRDVLVTSSGCPVTHKVIMLFNTLKGRVLVF